MRTHQSPSHRLRPLFWLWSGYLSGAIAWSLFHLVGYLWATLAWKVPARESIVATAAVTGLITLIGAWICYRAWDRTKAGDARDRSNAIGYLALSGVYLNAFFLASIVLTCLAVLFLGGNE